MTLKTVIYTAEDVENGFVKRLLEAYATWEATYGQRTPRPMYDGKLIRRNENGIGLEIDGLPLDMPAEYVSTALSAVTINDDFTYGDGILKAGTYRRGQTTAVVSMSICRPENRPAYGSWRIKVTGKTLRAAVGFYNDIRAGKIEPKVSWPTGASDQQ